MAISAARSPCSRDAPNDLHGIQRTHVCALEQQSQEKNALQLQERNSDDADESSLADAQLGDSDVESTLNSRSLEATRSPTRPAYEGVGSLGLPVEEQDGGARIGIATPISLCVWDVLSGEVHVLLSLAKRNPLILHKVSLEQDEFLGRMDRTKVGSEVGAALTSGKQSPSVMLRKLVVLQEDDFQAFRSSMSSTVFPVELHAQVCEHCAPGTLVTLSEVNTMYRELSLHPSVWRTALERSCRLLLDLPTIAAED
uniref:Uncharacterized protein n=1 Tax=Mycena chlorophos TaxID=658473 RepID=A0ABQ0KY22_MYCCL|nr:predicted protein [Mycena chlorophos]